MQVLESVLDPLHRRRLKDLFPTAPQGLDLVAEQLDTPLGLDQGLGQRLAPAALADEVTKLASRRRSADSSASFSFSVSGRSRSLAISSSTRRRT